VRRHDVGIADPFTIVDRDALDRAIAFARGVRVARGVALARRRVPEPGHGQRRA